MGEVRREGSGLLPVGEGMLSSVLTANQTQKHLCYPIISPCSKRDSLKCPGHSLCSWLQPCQNQPLLLDTGPPFPRQKSHHPHWEKPVKQVCKDKPQEEMNFFIQYSREHPATFYCHKKDDTFCILYTNQRNLSVPIKLQRTSILEKRVNHMPKASRQVLHSSR